MLYVDTSQSAITSTIGVMILPMFAVLFSHISGDFASLLTPPCVRGRQMLGSDCYNVLPPTEQLQGQWVVTTSDTRYDNTNFVLIFNDILFFSPGAGMLEQ